MYEDYHQFLLVYIKNNPFLPWNAHASANRVIIGADEKHKQNQYWL